MLREALDDDGGDGLVDAEVGAGAGGEGVEGRKEGRKKRVSFFFFFVVRKPLSSETGRKRTLKLPTTTHRLANCSENLRMVSSVLTSGSAVVAAVGVFFLKKNSSFKKEEELRTKKEGVERKKKRERKKKQRQQNALVRAVPPRLCELRSASLRVLQG